jgi:hypothetical protein
VHQLSQVPHQGGRGSPARDPRADPVLDDPAARRWSIGRLRARTGLGELLVFAAAALIAAGRLVVSGWPFDRVWAEDGAVFLADAVEHGWRSVGYSYAGYMHALPRFLALAGSHLPLAQFAPFALVLSILVCALVAALVHTAAHQVTGSTPWALAAALATVSAPALRTESLGSLANLQWFLLYGALWLCLARPDRTKWAVSAALALVAAATTPLTAVLFPVLLVVHRGRAWRHPATAGLAAGLVLQVLSRLLAPRSAGRVLDRDPGLPPGLGRTYLDSVAGIRSGVPETGTAFGVLLLLAGLTALWACRHDRLRTVSVIVIVALTGALLFVGTSVITNAATGRYIGVGTLFLWAALVLAASAAPPWAAAAVGTLLVTAAVLCFPADPYLVSGPSWATEVARATAGCEATDGPGTAVLPVGPDGWGTMTLPCGSLRGVP